jgi:hypothetical protein
LTIESHRPQISSSPGEEEEEEEEGEEEEERICAMISVTITYYHERAWMSAITSVSTRSFPFPSVTTVKILQATHARDRLES